MVKTKSIKIRIDLTGYLVDVYFTDNPEEFRNVNLIKKFPKLPKVEGEFIALHTFYWKHYPSRAWVILPHTKNIGLIVHEITHAVDRIIEYHGFEGTEIRAYLMEYIINKVL